VYDRALQARPGHVLAPSSELDWQAWVTVITRRQFARALGCAAVWPRAANAQRPALPVVGFLHPGDPAADADLAAMFRSGLREAGYIEGQNVTIEYGWVRNDNSRLPGLINDLVRRRVAVIAATGCTAARF